MITQNKITCFARGKPCTGRLPGCVGGGENLTTVLAHAPSVDKGMGFKGISGFRDIWGAHLCSVCHDKMDGRVNSGLMPKEKRDIWLSAIYETQKALFESGLIVVKS